MVRTDPSDNVLLELRRGAIVVAVLACLREEHYGYSLRERLDGDGLEVSEGTLYPLLRRLEAQGLLESRWDTDEARPRRYYRLSAAGASALERWTGQWRELAATMERMLGGSEEK